MSSFLATIRMADIHLVKHWKQHPRKLDKGDDTSDR
jgi:hypothetical protein